MALPKIDTPVYELDLPLSKKHIRFRPFLVKEQKNLMMALEADDKETIERNIKQVLTNCTITEDVDIDKLPVIDVEYYFINLRARSIGEMVENDYICTNEVNGEQCGGKMKGVLNLLEIRIDIDPNQKDVIQITDKIYDVLPVNPKVPLSVFIWKDLLKPLSLLAAGGVIGGSFLHYVLHGPKRPDPEEVIQEDKKQGGA
jgi:hypothetical protein